jgi:predicted O-linked N-acetylglucosamine transferase (SPINDLY family)
MVSEKIKEAIEMQNMGEWEGSIHLLQNEIQKNPGNTIALYSIAVSYFKIEKYEESLININNVIKLNQAFAPSYLIRSYLYSKLKKIELAKADALKAIELDPENAEAKLVLQQMKVIDQFGDKAQTIQDLLQQGIESQNKGMQEDAQIKFEKVLELDEKNYFALYSLGVLFNERGQSDTALRYLGDAASVGQNGALAFFAMATIYMQLKLYDLAIAAFDSAIKIDPKSTEAFNNKAVLLHDMHRHLEALETLDAGLKNFPDDLKTLGNKAYLLTEFKRHSEASSIFKKILKTDPARDYVLGLYAYSMLHTCNWEDFDENTQALAEGIENGARVVNPLAFMAFSDNGRLHKKCAETFGVNKFPASIAPLSSGERYVHQKKRVGFVSSDFREHPVGYLFIGLLELLDKNKIETYGFSLCHNDGSDLYKRFKSTFDNYLTCEDKTTPEIAGIIKKNEIDILVDLSGYTSGSRMELFGMRPAPTQVTYLGFPGTLGLPYIDYLIADGETVPLNNEQFFTEKILRLSNSYLPRDLGVLPSDSYTNKSDFELPTESFVFCSFNHEYKITPLIFKIWMELLHEVPQSVLWLMRLSQDTQTHISQCALSHGIDPARIIYAKRVPKIEDHLARYRHVDLCLDTYPYNGHTTTSDALFMGVPVVTLVGDSFASRVATGLLNDVGLKEKLSCGSYDSYKKCAVQLATKPDVMNEVRSLLLGADLDFWRAKAVKQAKEFSAFLTSI